MNIIVVGCGRHGAELAMRLCNNGHSVVVVEREEREFRNLPPEFHGRTVAGEPLDKDVLHRAGIEQADGLAAVTRSDSLNVVLGHVARTIYNVPHVVVRNFNPRWRPMHEAFGLQVVSSTDWGVQRIEEILYHEEMHSVYSAGNGEVEIYELTIGDKWQGHTAAELLPEGQTLPVALSRGGRAVLPDGDTCLQKDDTLYVSATLSGIGALRRRLATSQEK
jgi:trk system potassium uptake protein